MRFLLTLSVLAAALISTAAEASVQSCAETLLQSPNDVLYAQLQVTAAQAQQIGWVRDERERQRVELEAQLSELQAQVDEVSIYGGDDQLALLQSEEAPLVQELANVDLAAQARVSSLLTPRQQSQCAGVAAQPVVVQSPPVVVASSPVVVTRPRVVVTRPRIVVTRPPVVVSAARPVPLYPPVRATRPAPSHYAAAMPPVVRLAAVYAGATPARQPAAVAARGPVAHRAPVAVNLPRPGYRGSRQAVRAEGRPRRRF